MRTTCSNETEAEQRSHGSIETVEETQTKPPQELSEDETFCYLMNWIIHRMPNTNSVSIRLRAKGKMYQIEFKYTKSQLRVTRPIKKITEGNFILYDWTSKENFMNLTTERISNSMRRADEKNQTCITAESQTDDNSEAMDNLFENENREITKEDRLN